MGDMSPCAHGGLIGYCDICSPGWQKELDRIDEEAMTPHDETPETFELRCKDYDVSNTQALTEVIADILESHEELERDRNRLRAELAGVVERCKDIVYESMYGIGAMDRVTRNIIQRMSALTAAPKEPAPVAQEDAKSVRCFMDGIDWQYELGEVQGGIRLFPSIADTKLGKSCLAKGGGCGIVEVEVRLVRWVEEQDLHGEIDAARAGKREGDR